MATSWIWKKKTASLRNVSDSSSDASELFAFRFQRTGSTNPTVGKDECLRRSRRKTIKRDWHVWRNSWPSSSPLVHLSVRASEHRVRCMRIFYVHLSLCPRAPRPICCADFCILGEFHRSIAIGQWTNTIDRGVQINDESIINSNASNCKNYLLEDVKICCLI